MNFMSKYKTEKDFKKRCYELYQLDWMKTHGYSLQSIFILLKKSYIKGCSTGNIDGGTDCNNDFDVMEEHFKEQGFNGEIFACEEEFYDCEYQDPDYMKYLLPKDMFIQYINYNDKTNENKCKHCNGTGFMQIAPNVRGIKKCPFCNDK